MATVDEMTTSEKIKRIRNLWDVMYRASIRQEESVSKLVFLSGKSIEELVDLFAAGWTLEPPAPPDYNAMTKLAMEMEVNEK